MAIYRGNISLTGNSVISPRSEDGGSDLLKDSYNKELVIAELTRINYELLA